MDIKKNYSFVQHFCDEEKMNFVTIGWGGRLQNTPTSSLQKGKDFPNKYSGYDT